MITLYKKHLFKLFKWSAYVFLLLLLILSILFALIQTDNGKHLLANRISELLSSEPDFKIRIEGLDGFIPFDLSIAHVAVSDGAGKYLTIDDLSFRWSPLSFLIKPIRIYDLTIDDIQFIRLPVSQKPKKKTDKFNLPAWPPPIPPISVEKIEFGEVRLDKQVMGEIASFNLKGTMRSTGIDHLTKGEFTLSRTDRPGTQVELNFQIKGKEPELMLKAEVEEPEPGLIHSFSGLKEVGHIRATLEGQGPLSLWQGHLLAGVENLGEVETELELAFQKKLKLKSGGHLKLHDSVIPPSLSPLLDNYGIQFNIDIGYETGDQLNIENLELKTTKLRFSTQGAIDIKDQKLQGEYTLQFADLSVFDQSRQITMNGRLDIRGYISGPIDHPQIRMTTRATDIQYRDIHAAEVLLNILLQDRQGWPYALNDLVVKADGSVKGLEDPTHRRLLPSDPFKWSLETVIKKETPNVIKINDLVFKSNEAGLTFSGLIDMEPSILKGKAMLNIPQLELWAKTIGKKFQGELFLESDLQAEFKTRSLRGSIKGKARNLGGFHPELDGLFKEQTDLSIELNLVNAEKMELSKIKAQNSWIKMTGEGIVSLPNNEMEAHALLTLPALNVFSSLIDSPLKGKLEINSIIKGPFRDLNFQTEARGMQISYLGHTIRQFDLSLFTKNIAHNPEGLFTFRLYEGENNLRTTSNYSLKGSSLILSDLIISAEGNEIKGGLDIHFKGPAIKGVVRSPGIDLSSLSDILGEPLAGRLEFEAVLQSQKRDQEIILTLTGKKLATRFGSADSLELHASLEDVFRHPKGKINTEIKGLWQNDLKLMLLSLQAEGDIGRNDFSIQARGDYHGPFEIDTKGSMERVSAEDRLSLHQLQGRFQDYAINLVQDLIIIKTNDSYELKTTQLELGSGRLKAFGQFSPHHLSGRAILQDMPMKILSLTGMPEVMGSASGQLNLSGNPEQPQATLTLQAKDISLKDTSYMDLPPAQADIEIRYENRKLRASLLGKGLSAKPLKADMQIPAQISLSPMMFKTLSDEKISGKIDVEFELNRFPSFFYLEDQTLNGRLVSNIDLAGTVKKPKLSGDLVIRNGTYEHLRHGILLNDLTLEVRMSDDRIRLEKMEANDGEQGQLSAKGWVHLDREKGFPLEIELQIKNSTLVRRDDISVTTDGNIALSGNKDEALLSGQVTIGPAELRIPERLPPEVPDLKVTEVNSPAPKAIPEQKLVKKKKTKINLDLNLDFPGHTFVRGRGLDSEWQGKLHLSGTTDEPVITGGLSVVRGRYEFFGKPFFLARGELTLTGVSPPSPDLDILAEHKQSDLITRIGVRGNPSSLDIELTSEPALPSDEILSHLLFGRSAATITTFQALRLAAALKTLSGGGEGGMFNFMDNTRRLIGLDQLRLEETGDKEKTTSVSAGKYLNENVYLEVQKGLDSKGDNLSVEVQVTPNISVESEAGIDGQAGIGLTWEWTY